jgi:hypothetical protein
MKMLAVFAVSIMLMGSGSAKDKKNSNNLEPVVWGIISQNSGCVIFKEYRKTSGMFWGVAVTTKTRSFLEVLETQHYTLDQTKWDETDPESMDQLQRLSVKDKIKFVKIPEKYSDEQLDKARKMCVESPTLQ